MAAREVPIRSRGPPLGVEMAITILPDQLEEDVIRSVLGAQGTHRETRRGRQLEESALRIDCG